jgi:hypothetical protein
MNKPEELKKLAELINSLVDEDFDMSPSPDEDEWDNDYDPYFYIRHNEKAEDIEELCNACLIESGGHPDFEAMNELIKLSPRINRIHRGDGDSFGWLTGVIVIDNNKAIVYG